MNIIEHLCQDKEWRKLPCDECEDMKSVLSVMRFCQHSIIPHDSGQRTLAPVLESAQWVGECPEGHQVRVLVDGNILHALKHPDDYLQPDDPRFKMVYPKQYAEIERNTEMKRQQEEAQYQQTNQQNREFKKRFGKRGESVLQALEDKHPDLKK